mmetsp:Transcript_5231/g.13343  ORF Transcript_5231/g.13343 Transcript_5231/m.13343 type:complete len:229 (+) Transcript_5231:426-1112(+)
MAVHGTGKAHNMVWSRGIIHTACKHCSKQVTHLVKLAVIRTSRNNQKVSFRRLTLHQDSLLVGAIVLFAVVGDCHALDARLRWGAPLARALSFLVLFLRHFAVLLLDSLVLHALRLLALACCLFLCGALPRLYGLCLLVQLGYLDQRVLKLAVGTLVLGLLAACCRRLILLHALLVEVDVFLEEAVGAGDVVNDALVPRHLDARECLYASCLPSMVRMPSVVFVHASP